MNDRRHERALVAGVLCLGAGAVVLQALLDLPPVMKAIAFVMLLAGTAALVWRLYYRPADIAELRRRKGQCPECGYDLRHNVSGVCPECGKKIQSGMRK